MWARVMMLRAAPLMARATPWTPDSESGVKARPSPGESQPSPAPFNTRPNKQQLERWIAHDIDVDATTDVLWQVPLRLPEPTKAAEAV
jgi:hypothetical protein